MLPATAMGMLGSELIARPTSEKPDNPSPEPLKIPRYSSILSALYNLEMPISARNKLRGKIEEIQLGDVMAHVAIRVGDNLIESAITRRSADELKLKKGDSVTAVIKATEVMIQKD